MLDLKNLNVRRFVDEHCLPNHPPLPSGGSGSLYYCPDGATILNNGFGVYKLNPPPSHPLEKADNQRKYFRIAAQLSAAALRALTALGSGCGGTWNWSTESFGPIPPNRDSAGRPSLFHARKLMEEINAHNQKMLAQLTSYVSGSMTPSLHPLAQRTFAPLTRANGGGDEL